MQVPLGWTQLPAQPCTGHAPIVTHGSVGDFQDFGDLLLRQSPEELELDNTRAALVQSGELLQRFVHGEYVIKIVDVQVGKGAQRYTVPCAASLGAYFATEMFEQRLAYGRRGHRAELFGDLP
jgi:hypothetical protein